VDGPARYLSAVLKWSGILFDHRPDQARIPKAWRKKSYDAIILSDYRYASFTPCAREWLISGVEKGAGLLMIGGWASFTGLVGGYAGTDIEKLLPVKCIRGDDRVNCSGGAVIGVNPIVGAGLVPARNLNWGQPPVICGYHRAIPKPGSQVVLALRELRYGKSRVGTRPTPTLGKSHPLLVTGQYDRTRTAAFLTDCAPHWAGGLVDWGASRERVRVGAGIVEVGRDYLRFFRGLLGWLAHRGSIS
jgi:uncharacterized membrane protein